MKILIHFWRSLSASQFFFNYLRKYENIFTLNPNETILYEREYMFKIIHSTWIRTDSEQRASGHFHVNIDLPDWAKFEESRIASRTKRTSLL